jgi:hypothetical protein
MICKICGEKMKPWYDLLKNIKVYQCPLCNCEFCLPEGHYFMDEGEWVC